MSPPLDEQVSIYGCTLEERNMRRHIRQVLHDAVLAHRPAMTVAERVIATVRESQEQRPEQLRNRRTQIIRDGPPVVDTTDTDDSRLLNRTIEGNWATRAQFEAMGTPRFQRHLLRLYIRELEHLLFERRRTEPRADTDPQPNQQQQTRAQFLRSLQLRQVTVGLLRSIDADPDPNNRQITRGLRPQIAAGILPHLNEHCILVTLQMMRAIVLQDASLMRYQDNYLLLLDLPNPVEVLNRRKLYAELLSHYSDSERQLRHRIMEGVRQIQSLLPEDPGMQRTPLAQRLIDRHASRLGGHLVEEMRRSMKAIETSVNRDMCARQQLVRWRGRRRETVLGQVRGLNLHVTDYIDGPLDQAMVHMPIEPRGNSANGNRAVANRHLDIPHFVNPEFVERTIREREPMEALRNIANVAAGQIPIIPRVSVPSNMDTASSRLRQICEHISPIHNRNPDQ